METLVYASIGSTVAFVLCGAFTLAVVKTFGKAFGKAIMDTVVSHHIKV